MYKITLIEGDWIGPEVSAVMKEVVSASGVSIEWETHAFEQGQLTDELLISCHRNGLVVKGRTEAVRREGQLPSTVALKKELGLWGTVRPVKSLKGVGSRFIDLDLVVIRETSEDIYAGFEHQVTEGVFEAVKITTQRACEQIAIKAFDYALANGRKKVTIVHKSNIMKKSDGMFLRTAKRLSEQYPDLEVNEVIVDALCEKLVRWPYQFDVLLTLNLFGDIVSDLCSGLAGGIVASPSMSEGIYRGAPIFLFEALHGKVPELVGKDQANPIPMLNVATMLLRHLKEDSAADKIQKGIETTLLNGIKTQDLGGSSSTSEFKHALLKELS
ncbi:MAG: isocitrate dehydrogenase [Proteobacteria bacterium]|nr:isocitrate dehydrogenase [Pseudomonadota bacterium]